MKKIKQKLVAVNAKDELCFWINNGPILKNLEDLKNALKKISEETFKYHVSKEKNDFANWVKNVLGDKVLANKLARIRTIKTMIKTVEERLKEYENIKLI